jgi:hypothetical protein
MPDTNQAWAFRSLQQASGVAASRPKVLAMALSQGQKTIAKLRLTMLPGQVVNLLV